MTYLLDAHLLLRQAAAAAAAGAELRLTEQRVLGGVQLADAALDDGGAREVLRVDAALQLVAQLVQLDAHLRQLPIAKQHKITKMMSSAAAFDE